MNEAERRFVIHLSLGSLVLIVAIWLSSGTMAPYALTLDSPLVLKPCGYLVNIDHERFLKVFRMLRHEDPTTWRWSPALRRPLFAVLALPLVNAFGVLTGGLIASAVIHVVALNAFCVFIKRRVGQSGAIATIWLLATYPGITYWAALPYSYVMIVPGALISMMLLYRLLETQSILDLLATSLALGIFFTGYDIYPYFGLAAVLILLWRRRVIWTAIAFVVMALPQIVLSIVFSMAAAPAFYGGKKLYAKILHAYLHPHDTHFWVHLLAELPMILLSTFLYSNFVALPLLFVLALVVWYKRRAGVLALPEYSVVAAGIVVFLINNAAPPYPGIQMRGYWMPRVYQAVFPAFLMVIARATEHVGLTASWRGAIAMAIAFNASIAFGPILRNPIASEVYFRFYNHFPQKPPRTDAMIINLKRYGRRPLGICR